MGKRLVFIFCIVLNVVEVVNMYLPIVTGSFYLHDVDEVSSLPRHGCYLMPNAAASVYHPLQL